MDLEVCYVTTSKQYFYRIENNLCLQCGRPRIENSKMCQLCKDKLKQKYKKLKNDNICVNCRKPNNNGFTKCNECKEKNNKAGKERRKFCKENSLCISCGKQSKKSHCDECLKKNRDKANNWKENCRCRSCGIPVEKKGRRCKRCRNLNKQSMDRLKLEVLDAYGGRECVCCGETIVEFLTIDHINGDGGKHRKEVNGSMYIWLRKNNYPEGFQVLCMNCNFGKRLSGICPHKYDKNNPPEYNI